MAGDDVKLPLFHGKGTEDPKQYWFLYEVVWTLNQFQNEYINKGQLAIIFQGRALYWLMNFI